MEPRRGVRGEVTFKTNKSLEEHRNSSSTAGVEMKRTELGHGPRLKMFNSERVGKTWDCGEKGAQLGGAAAESEQRSEASEVNETTNGKIKQTRRGESNCELEIKRIGK